MRYDLHVHTKYSQSDGVLAPKEVIKIAKKIGLDGVAITDHNTIKGGLEAKRFETKDFKIIVGSEVMSERGEIIGLFLSEEIMSRKARDIFNEIKQQNGLVLIPHPFDRMRSSALRPKKSDIKYIDAVEVFNSRCVFNKYNKEALEFANRKGLGVCAGSDAHYRGEIGRAGIITESDDVRSALLQKDNDVFGKRSSLMFHVYTKLTKYHRRLF